MLILILIDVHYSQKVVFSFEKGSNCQNHPSSGSLYLLVKKYPPASPLPPFPYPLLFGKPYSREKPDGFQSELSDHYQRMFLCWPVLNQHFILYVTYVCVSVCLGVF